MALPLSYHWRSLLVRKTPTVLTVMVIAAVVAVFVWMLGFRVAMVSSLSMAGDPAKIIVLRRGSTSESNSAIPVDEVSKLDQVVGLERNSRTGEAMLSPELMVQTSLPRLRDQGRTNANIAVRGVTMRAFDVHSNIRLEGSCFSTGTPEVIVGKTASQQFAGLRLGDAVRLGYSGDRTYKVVGFFTAGGGPMESEIWAYLPSLMNSYSRTLYSSASLRLAPAEAFSPAIAQIQGPAIQMSAFTEADYWSSQTRVVKSYLAIAGVLIVVMCVAAVFSIANTMFSSVSGRTREIAMLRTIGFDRGAILVGFVVESVMLSLVGGLLGVVSCMAWLHLAGSTKDVFGAHTFTTMAFQIRITPAIIACSLTAIAAVGVVGALAPAYRASRTQIVVALRDS